MRHFITEKLVLLLLVVFGVTLIGTAILSAEESVATEESAIAEVAEKAPAVVKKLSQPSFGLDRLNALQGELMGYPLWQYVASLVWVFLAFLVASLIDLLITGQLKRLARHTTTELDDRLLEVLHTPVKLTIFLVMLNAGIRVFSWPEWLENALATLFTLSVAAAVIYLAVRLIDLLASFLEKKFFADDSQMAQLMMPVISKSLKVFVIIIGVLTAAQYLGFPIASVIAGLGIGGIAVALAAQDTLANLFGTVALLIDRPFRVGDRIQVDNYDGPVETIGLRSTRIRTLDGHLVTIPNKVVANSGINNISMRPTIRQNMTIGLVYGTTPAQMREAVRLLREIFGQHPQTQDFWVHWKDYSACSLDIFVAYWCKSTVYQEFLQALEEINLQIKERFDAAGLDFAFPTQTIHLHQEGNPLPAQGVSA